MKELIEKRERLMKFSMRLSLLKFKGDLNGDEITKLIKEQDKVYRKHKFYKEYIKAINNI